MPESELVSFFLSVWLVHLFFVALSRRGFPPGAGGIGSAPFYKKRTLVWSQVSRSGENIQQRRFKVSRDGPLGTRHSSTRAS